MEALLSSCPSSIWGAAAALEQSRGELAANGNDHLTPCTKQPQQRQICSQTQWWAVALPLLLLLLRSFMIFSMGQILFIGNAFQWYRDHDHVQYSSQFINTFNSSKRNDLKWTHELMMWIIEQNHFGLNRGKMDTLSSHKKLLASLAQCLKISQKCIIPELLCFLIFKACENCSILK